MCSLALEGNIKAARNFHLKLFPVIKALFIETNPIPIKKAMELMGMHAGKPRLPLVEMNQDNVTTLRKTLIDYGIKL
jgi:4-hydroxy-tetrahydrodipicolinate synthase